MKSLRYVCLSVVLTALLSTSSFCQTQDEPKAHGGGPLDMPQMEIQCTIHEYDDEIMARLARERMQLVEKGILPPKENIARNQAVTLFQWPLRQANGFSQFSYYTTVNFVDLDPSGGIQDYNCGSRSYNGHRGIDISLWPFWWKMMGDNQVEIIAAAPGTITAKFDGNFDMNCSCTGSWNAVYVEHADGSTAWYGHMKSGTLTSKAVGASVSTGEYLGVVGSSGCSSNPHLHFEIRDVNNNVIEPYDGPCNNTTTSSWWVSQKPYWEPILNNLLTHDVPPDPGGFCPNTEFPNIENNFDPGDLIRYGAYYNDQLNGHLTTYNVKNPNGTTVHSWSHTSPGTYTWSWWYWNYTMPSSAVEGVYSFNATYNGGSTKSHYFYVGCPNNLTVSNQTITSDVEYNAAQTITTTGTVRVQSGGGIARFRASNLITMGSGFRVDNGAYFIAQMSGCP